MHDTLVLFSEDAFIREAYPLGEKQPPPALSTLVMPTAVLYDLFSTLLAIHWRFPQQQSVNLPGSESVTYFSRDDLSHLPCYLRQEVPMLSKSDGMKSALSTELRTGQSAPNSGIVPIPKGR